MVFSHYLILFFNPFLIVTLFLIISYSYFFIIFLNPNSSFFSINKPLPLHFSSSSLLSLLRFLGLYLFGEQECFLQVCVGVLACLVGWSLDCAIRSWISFSSRCDLSIFFLCEVCSSSFLFTLLFLPCLNLATFLLVLVLPLPNLANLLCPSLYLF